MNSRKVKNGNGAVNDIKKLTARKIPSGALFTLEDARISLLDQQSASPSFYLETEVFR